MGLQSLACLQSACALSGSIPISFVRVGPIYCPALNPDKFHIALNGQRVPRHNEYPQDPVDGHCPGKPLLHVCLFPDDISRGRRRGVGQCR